MNFADTNWLIALYTNPPEKQKGSRQNIAANFMRRNDGRLALSHPVLIETHNILCRLSGKPNPDEWEELQADFKAKSTLTL
ncbi:MAG TPA: hypothetical protein VFM25_03020 [Verrucomicrobiae bacterium]|nr:hypothetical protein [Verrucomicrobiae bacterium]